jgi:hypothetical protein
MFLTRVISLPVMVRTACTTTSKLQFENLRCRLRLVDANLELLKDHVEVVNDRLNNIERNIAVIMEALKCRPQGSSSPPSKP